MKKSLLLFATLAPLFFLSENAFAQEKEKAPKQNPPRPPSEVFLSSPCSTFEMNFTALYMQPTGSNLDYAAEAKPLLPGIPFPAISPNWIIHEISPDYHFGFIAGIGGVFHETNSNLTLNWERYHSPNDSNSTFLPSIYMIGPFFEIGPDAHFYKQAKGSVHFHFDEVNLDFGTFVNFGNRLCMNLFSGASFARIVQQRKTRFANDGGTIVRTITVPSKFTGGGPQLGLDFIYKVAGGFQFVGNTRATLFIGSMHNKTVFSTTSPDLASSGNPNPNVQTTNVKNRTGIVPGFEGKLGFAYDFQVGCNYMVKLEFGYQAQIYLNAIRSIDMGSEVTLSEIEGGTVTGATGVYARTFQRTLSDFALAGPYLSLNLGF